MGIGGTPEGVIAAAALKCVGGGVQGKLWPRNDEERQELVDAGFDLDRVLTTDDLVAGEDVFVAATGVTTGALLRGVRYTRDGARHRLDRDALALRHGAAHRGDARAREARALHGPPVPLDRGRFASPSPARTCPFARRRSSSRGGSRPAGAASTFSGLAAPGLQRRRLQRAAVRERELPRVRPARVHRVQVRGRVLVGLAAGEEDDPRHRRRHVPVEARRASPRRPRRRRRGRTPRSRRAPCSA